MAEDAVEQPESLMENIKEKIHGHDSSSSLDSDNDDKPSMVDAVEATVFRLFGREKPVHKVLGGGKRTHTYLFSLSLNVRVIIHILFVVWLIGKMVGL